MQWPSVPLSFFPGVSDCLEGVLTPFAFTTSMTTDVRCIYSYSALQEMNEVFPKKGSIDLIFGRPHQTLDDWIKELVEVSYILISSDSTS